MTVTVTDVPLIYTKNGNVPLDSLRYEKDWQINDDMAIFREFWFDEAGELVKNNVHIHVRRGVSFDGAQAQM